jgi:hypothetical protein
MNVSSARLASSAHSDPAARLRVVFACHELVCALPIASLDRLAGADDVQKQPSASRPAHAGGTVPLPEVVKVGEERFAAWDLGQLLGLGAVSGAWVLLRVSHAGADLPLALRTGRCFSVQELPRLVKLPPAIFQARRAAIAEGFAAAAVKQAHTTVTVGLSLDPARLWTRPELEASAAALAFG